MSCIRKFIPFGSKIPDPNTWIIKIYKKKVFLLAGLTVAGGNCLHHMNKKAITELNRAMLIFQIIPHECISFTAEIFVGFFVAYIHDNQIL